MIDHVTIRVADLDLAHDFYERALRLLDRPQTGEADRGFEWNDFSIVAATTERSPTRRLHIGFGARDRDQVDDWWQAMRDAGDPDLGGPGPRPYYTPTYYGAFVADPAGNSIEALHHDHLRTDGCTIDHCGSVSETSSARAASTRRWRRSWATTSRGTRNEPPSAEAPRPPSRSSPAIPRRICTSPSKPRTRPPWTRSTALASMRAMPRSTTRANGRSTTPATTARPSQIRIDSCTHRFAVVGPRDADCVGQAANSPEV